MGYGLSLPDSKGMESTVAVSTGQAALPDEPSFDRPQHVLVPIPLRTTGQDHGL